MEKPTTVAAILLIAAAALAAPSAAADAVAAEAREAPYRHSQPQLDSAMRFLAQTVSEETQRIEQPTYRVNVSGFCILRFDRLDAGPKVPVHVVDLSRLDPRESSAFERTICLETTSLENRIAYYELPRAPDWTYRYDDSPIPDSRGSTDRFCFVVSRATAHRISRALDFALESCGARSEW